MSLSESYQHLSNLLTGELYRHVSATDSNLLNLVDSPEFIEAEVLNDVSFLDYLNKVYFEFLKEAAHKNLTEHFHRWAWLLTTKGIDFVLVTQATHAGLKRLKRRTSNREFLQPDDFRELLFLIVVAHAQHK